ncbi:helix-turn-helix domain-containing protein [Neobacillus drentensis]|uniref:helix-turn-helix domain-containing protein n=1 Tax=Neobacillus drentensis TaxID=220684 RepID=UPI003000A1C8
MDGNILKRIRQEKGYSLTKLGKLAGISKSYLSLLERGIQKNPSIEIIEKIAKVLEVDINYLIDSTENKNPYKSTLKLEINLSEDDLNQDKLEQIKELISLLGKEEKE